MGSSANLPRESGMRHLEHRKGSEVPGRSCLRPKNLVPDPEWNSLRRTKLTRFPQSNPEKSDAVAPPLSSKWMGRLGQDPRAGEHWRAKKGCAVAPIRPAARQDARTSSSLGCNPLPG